MVAEDFARILREQGSALRAQLSDLDAGLAGIDAATAGANSDDEHDPEGATLAFERAQLVAVRDGSADRLREIEDAQARLLTGGFGGCEQCAAMIGAGRLSARPWTRLCLDCADPAPGRARRQ